MKTDHSASDQVRRLVAGRMMNRRQLVRWAGRAAGAAMLPAALAANAGSTLASSGGTLTVATGTDPGVLDPDGVNGAVSEATAVFGQIFEPLVDVQYPSVGSPKIVPLLATSWRSVDDLTWEFKLRPNVKFHNGDPFTADDVQFSVQRILDPALHSPVTQFIPTSLDHVEVVDPLTVRFITKTPYPLMPLDASRFRIVPKKYTQAKRNVGFGKAPVGTGPFMFVQYITNDHTTLKKNPNYWGGAPKLDQITFKPMPEASTRTAALLSGTADIITLVQISDINLIKGTSGLTVAKVPSLRSMFIQLDSIADTPLKDPRVRAALNYAVDKDELINTIFEGNGLKLDGQLVPQQAIGHNPDLQPFPYDVSKAKSLLAAAGYPNGFSITLRGTNGRYVNDKELTQAVAGQLQKAGVKANVQTYDWSVYVANLYKRGLSPSFLLGWAPIPDALGYLTLNLSTSIVHYQNAPAYDAIVNKASQTINNQQRQQLYNQATQWLYTNPAAIYLHQQMNIYGVSAKVSGFEPSPDEFMRLAKVGKA